jgi:putative DNA primase/helicase
MNLETIVPQEETERNTENYTDMGNASRLVRRYGDRLRHVAGWGWMVYDGKRWTQDKQDKQVMEYAKQTVRDMYREAAEIADPSERLALVKHAENSESGYRLEQMVKLAKSDRRLAATVDQFDTDPLVLNVANGTLDLRTRELRPHNPADLITKLAPVNYNPDAHGTVFEKFLNDVFEGDQDMIAFVQRAIGYSLTGETNEPAFFIPWGAGRNGKSTLLRAVTHVLGEDYTASTDKRVFLRGGDAHTLARLYGVRMVLTSETEQGEPLNISLIKQLTGGDRVSARHLYQEEFDFQPAMKVWMATNNKPEIPENSNAIWARVYLIPFDVSFLGREDKNMGEKLQAEAEAILIWMVNGCIAWQGQGLNPPEKVRAATQAYRNEQDTLADFFDARCVLEPSMTAQSKLLYVAYTEWCNANSERPVGDREFARQLEARGLRRKKSNGKMIWQGIGIVQPQQPYTHAVPAYSSVSTDQAAYEF